MHCRWKSQIARFLEEECAPSAAFGCRSFPGRDRDHGRCTNGSVFVRSDIRSVWSVKASLVALRRVRVVSCVDGGAVAKKRQDFSCPAIKAENSKERLCIIECCSAERG